MTNIEMDVARSQIRANKAIASLIEINWERRRYEIAKEMLPQCSTWYADKANEHELTAKEALRYADALIKELKGE